MLVAACYLQLTLYGDKGNALVLATTEAPIQTFKVQT